MEKWPASLPDYSWPHRLLSRARAPRRVVSALTFHAAYFLGLIFSTLRTKCLAILVIRTDGIGDAVLYEPALRSLAGRFPARQLHLWAPAATCDLLAEHPAISQSLIIPRGAKAGNLEYFSSIGWRMLMGWRLGRYRFETAVYTVESPEPLGNWILSSVRATDKWYAPGDNENQFDWQQKRTVASANKLVRSLEAGGHELLRNANFARQWGGDAASSPLIEPDGITRSLARAQVQFWRKASSGNSSTELAGVMVGSATGVNAYPIKAWARIVRVLWSERRATCVLFGGPADASRVDELVKLISDIPHLRLPPGASLRLTSALLREMDGFITMDTGLAHIALAQGEPAVVLANGGHPGRFFPWPIPTRSVLLTHRMPCEGCLCRCVLAEPECVTRINPDDVVAAYATVTRAAVRAVA